MDSYLVVYGILHWHIGCLDLSDVEVLVPVFYASAENLGNGAPAK
jgi:hypothetical protein